MPSRGTLSWMGAFLLVAALRVEVRVPEGFQSEAIVDATVLKEPMDVAFAPDGAAWVTGRAGDVWRVEVGSKQAHRVGGVETDVSAQSVKRVHVHE